MNQHTRKTDIICSLTQRFSCSSPGVDSSDEDSDSNSDLEELPWQREWVITSSDDDNEDDE